MFKTLSDVFSIDSEPDPVLIIQGPTDFTCTLQKSQQQLHSFSFILVGKKIDQKKKKEVSTHQMWDYEMTCSRQIRFSLLNRESQFNKI